MIIALLFVAVALLAYSNGANDNFKGVASLFGSETTSYRTAIGWATATTFAGSLAAIFLAQTLLARFSGCGLVPDSVVGSDHFLLAIALGAGATIMVATLTGFPVSTTHGLTGAMVGAGVMAVGTELNFAALRHLFLLPLLLSPLLAVGLGAGLYVALHRLRLRLDVAKEWCVCVGTEERLVPLLQFASALSVPQTPALTIVVDSETRCAQRYVGAVLGVNVQRVMDAAHFASAGVVSFARGLNDTPKMAALLLVVQALDVSWGMVLIAAAMAAGGLLSARRVAETMSHRITAIDHGQGLAANLATGALVIGASRWGLPVSTTHISVGSLFGIGATNGEADLRVVSGILLSWLLTLPCAALLSAAAYWLAVR